MKKLISLILAIALALSFSSMAFASQTSESIDGSNWMSALNGEKFITSINMPGTHDSAAKNAMPFNAVSCTQNKTIAEQLYSGVRYLDIRLELTKKGEIIVVHDISKCMDKMGLTSKAIRMSDVVNTVIDFLNKNPGEAVFLHVREDAGEAGYELYNKLYQECIVPNMDKFYIRNDKPVLNEVRGKIVLLRGIMIDETKYDDTNSGINFTYYPFISSTELNDFRYRPVAKISINYYYATMFVQDSYKLKAEDKCTTAKNFLDGNLFDGEYNICALNCIGSGTPHYCSEKVNSWFMSYPLTNGKAYGIISADFITDEMCKKIYMTNIFVKEPNAKTQNTETISYSLFGRPLQVIKNIMQKIESNIAKAF